MAEVISFPQSRSSAQSGVTSWPGTLIDLDAARKMAGEDYQTSTSDEPDTAPDGGSRDSARQIAVRALAARGRSVAELRQKLLDRGIATDIVDSEIQRLIDEGILDDRVLAEQLVWSLREHKKLGPVAIRQALMKRKIPAAIIEQVVLPSDQSEREVIAELVDKRLNSLTGLEQEVQVRRLLGYLARRGYQGPDAFQAVKEAVRSR